MCGVKTNIVTAVEIHGRNTNDSKLLPPMVESTARNFQISEVSADKGYASRSNTEAVACAGATPYISFASHHRGNGNGKWAEMYRLESVTEKGDRSANKTRIYNRSNMGLQGRRKSPSDKFVRQAIGYLFD